MEHNSGAVSRRATGIWRFRGTGQGGSGVHTPLNMQSSVATSVSVGHEDHIDGTFEFGGIRVKLVTYKSIPGVVLVNASKTMSEWNTLRALHHPNIVGFDDNNSGTGHWLPTKAGQDETDPKGQCELYVMKPPLSVTVAAAAAQYPWSLLDVRRICKDTLHALEYLAGQNLLRGNFTAEHILVTGEGFKLANVHLCQVAQDNCDVGDLRSVGRMIKEILEGSDRVPDNGEWIDFYKVAMKELSFKEYREVLPELLERYWPPHGGEYENSSQEDRLRGIAYLVSQRQRNTFQW